MPYPLKQVRRFRYSHIEWVLSFFFWSEESCSNMMNLLSMMYTRARSRSGEFICWMRIPSFVWKDSTAYFTTGVTKSSASLKSLCTGTWRMEESKFFLSRHPKERPKPRRNTTSEEVFRDARKSMKARGSLEPFSSGLGRLWVPLGEVLKRTKCTWETWSSVNSRS